MGEDEERAIRERAYEIWESEGRPDGRGAEHWNQARAEIHEQQAQLSPSAGERPIGTLAEAPRTAKPRAAAGTRTSTRAKKKVS